MFLSRRAVLSGAAAAPILALLGHGPARGAEKAALVRIIDGWGQARLTPEAVKVLAEIQGTVYAVKPARLLSGTKTPTVRTEIRAGKLNPNLTEIMGTIVGGVGLRTPKRDNRVQRLSGSVLVERRKGHADLTGKGTAVVNGETVELGPLTTTALDESRVTVEPGKPGKPTTVRVEVPVYATEEMIELFTLYFGTSVAHKGFKVAHATAECRYWPPK